MVKLLFFCFQVTSLKYKKFQFGLLTRLVNFYFFHFRITNVKLKHEKNPLNITVRMFVNPQKSIPLLRFLITSYNSISLGCSGMLKSRSNKDMVSNRWESIRTLLSGYIPLEIRDIQVQSFNQLTSSYLKWCACSQILAFLTALINTWKKKTTFEMPK